MKKLNWILAIAVVAALGCKKDDAAPAQSPAPMASPSTSATPSGSPSATPTGAPTPAPSADAGGASLASLAGEWQVMEKGTAMPDSSFTLNADGSWKMHVVKDGQTTDIEGTSKVEGSDLVLTIMPPAGAPKEATPQEQKLQIEDGGKRLKDPDGENDLVKK